MNRLRAALNFYKVRSSWLGDGGQPVEREQAQSRANVCIACSHNADKAVWEILTIPAIEITQRQLSLKHQMHLALENENALHICDICLCALRLKVFVPIKHLKDTTDTEELPAHCWMKKELTN